MSKAFDGAFAKPVIDVVTAGPPMRTSATDMDAQTSTRVGTLAIGRSPFCCTTSECATAQRPTQAQAKSANGGPMPALRAPGQTLPPAPGPSPPGPRAFVIA